MAYTQDFGETAVTEAVSAEESVAAEAAETVECDAGEETADTAAVASKESVLRGPTGVSVRFNHQTRELSEEEAALYAQKGLKWESFQGDYDRLRFLAEGAGQSVSQLIEGWMAKDEERERQEALSHCQDPETAQQLIALRRQQRMARFQSSEQQEIAEEQGWQEHCNRRLAADYCALREAVPEAPSFDKLPERVIRTAVEQGISLFDAYLRYGYEQQRLASEATAARQRAAQASTGSLRGEAAEEGRERRDFLTAFEQVFT